MPRLPDMNGGCGFNPKDHRTSAVNRSLVYGRGRLESRCSRWAFAEDSGSGNPTPSSRLHRLCTHMTHALTQTLTKYINMQISPCKEGQRVGNNCKFRKVTSEVKSFPGTGKEPPAALLTPARCSLTAVAATESRSAMKWRRTVTPKSYQSRLPGSPVTL